MKMADDSVVVVVVAVVAYNTVQWLEFRMIATVIYISLISTVVDFVHLVISLLLLLFHFRWWTEFRFVTVQRVR